MSTKKKSFILYDDFHDQLADLTPEQAGHYIKSIYAHRHEEEYICDDPLVKFALKGVMSQFKRDEAKYDETCVKRSESGRKGGLAKVANAKSAKQTKQNVANLAESVSDSVSDSVSEKKTPKALIAFALGLVDEGSRKELIKEWLEYRIDLKKPMKTEVGLKKMVSEWSKYTDTQVRQVMDFTISKEYQGMIWDKLGNSTSSPAQQTEYKGPTV